MNKLLLIGLAAGGAYALYKYNSGTPIVLTPSSPQGTTVSDGATTTTVSQDPQGRPVLVRTNISTGVQTYVQEASYQPGSTVIPSVVSSAITTLQHPTSIGLMMKCDCARGGTCQTSNSTCECCDRMKVSTMPQTLQKLTYSTPVNRVSF